MPRIVSDNHSRADQFAGFARKGNGCNGCKFKGDHSHKLREGNVEHMGKNGRGRPCVAEHSDGFVGVLACYTVMLALTGVSQGRKPRVKFLRNAVNGGNDLTFAIRIL